MRQTREKTPVDDLKVGQYVCVVASNEAQPIDWHGPKPTGGFCGQPLRIMQISLPFLAVLMPTGQPASIDVRAWQLKRVTRKYALIFFAKLNDQAKAEIVKAIEAETTRPAGGNLCYCPRCGERLVEVLQKRDWVKTCRGCGRKPVETSK